MAKTATVAELREANKVVEFAKESSSEGFRFCSIGIDWNTAVLLTVTDASFANVDIDVGSVREPYHSQQGLFHCLASPEVMTDLKCVVHPI